MTPSQKYRTIPLTRGQVALVDAVDYERLSQWTWFADARRDGRGYYARRHTPMQKGKRSTVSMHREIMNAKRGVTVDHINLNSLDNRRANLRLATMSQQMFNKTKTRDNRCGYKGVSLYKGTFRVPHYKAAIVAHGVRYHLGYHETAEAAHAAYCEAAKRLHQEFARFA